MAVKLTKERQGLYNKAVANLTSKGMSKTQAQTEIRAQLRSLGEYKNSVNKLNKNMANLANRWSKRLSKQHGKDAVKYIPLKKKAMGYSANDVLRKLGQTSRFKVTKTKTKTK